jgi:hypothetical protein
MSEWEMEQAKNFGWRILAGHQKGLENKW